MCSFKGPSIEGTMTPIGFLRRLFLPVKFMVAHRTACGKLIQFDTRIEKNLQHNGLY